MGSLGTTAKEVLLESKVVGREVGVCSSQVVFCTGDKESLLLSDVGSIRCLPLAEAWGIETAVISCYGGAGNFGHSSLDMSTDPVLSLNARSASRSMSPAGPEYSIVLMGVMTYSLR